MGNVEPADEDDMKIIKQIILKALDPTNGLSEDEKARGELLVMVHNSLKNPEVLRRIADRTEGKKKVEPADVFAAGIMWHLFDEGALTRSSHLERLFRQELIAHWLRMFEKYLNQGEL